MDPNKLTIYGLTQPTEMHKDYGWWHIQRNGDGLADVQNQHEALKIVEELQRQADEVHALRAEVERLREECRRIISEADTLSSHVDIDVDWRYYQGQQAAAKRLLASQPTPAPPKEE